MISNEWKIEKCSERSYVELVQFGSLVTQFRDIICAGNKPEERKEHPFHRPLSSSSFSHFVNIQCSFSEAPIALNQIGSVSCHSCQIALCAEKANGPSESVVPWNLQPKLHMKDSDKQ
jgi:hypothetical protein